MIRSGVLSQHTRSLLTAVVLTAAALIAMAAPASAAILIPGEEITSRPAGWSKDSSHMVAINTWSHTDASLSIQGQINAVRAKGGQAILPHPYVTSRTPGFSYTQIKGVTGFMGIELTKLVNNDNSSLRYYGWDEMGTWSPVYHHFFNHARHGMWGFRNPDNDFNNESALLSANVVRANGLTAANIMNALKRGDFYAFRTGHEAPAAVAKSFPIPKVTSTGVVTVTAPKGYSVRFFSATTNTPLSGTCSYTNGYTTTSATRSVCASDDLQHTFSRKPTGTEKFIKVVVIKYTDTWRYPNALYQPIYINSNGSIGYNPYPTLTTASKYLGAIHSHTKMSKDNPYGPSPATSFEWFTRKGYNFVNFTDHNRVTKDIVRPKPIAVADASTYKDKWVNLYYKFVDNSGAKIQIKIKNKATGSIVKTLTPGWKSPGVLYHQSFQATLPRGTYSYGVYAMDSSYNWGPWSSWKTLTIK